MSQIIINADDFGINEIVTNEIERQILAGNVSSTTVMANGCCLDEVKRFAAQHVDVSFGIHLCLSEFDSLTKSEGLFHAGLTDENGRFLYRSIFYLKNLRKPDVQKAIHDELNAQIDVVSSLGFPLSHADSHHHVHTIFSLKELFVNVFKERGIKRIRLGEDFSNWRSKKHLVLWCQRMKLNKMYETNFLTTDAFYSYADFINHGAKCGEDIIELMCHPGHPGQKYQNEMKLVMAKEALNFVDSKLITYNDLY